MSFLCCVRPYQICCIRRDGYRLKSWGAHAIHRSMLFALPRPPIYRAGLAHFPVPWYVLSGAGVRLEWRAERPLCRGHEVAGRPYHVLVMQVSMLPPLIGVATCALGS